MIEEDVLNGRNYEIQKHNTVQIRMKFRRDEDDGIITTYNKMNSCYSENILGSKSNHIDGYH